MKNLYGNTCLLLAAVIWGFAFVAQSIGMRYVGPFTFLCTRSFIGAAALLPVLLFLHQKKGGKKKPEKKNNKHQLLFAGIICGIILCTASALQQIGLQYTTVGKAGFITSMYVLAVPLLGLFLGRHIPTKIWLCIILASIGLYLLSITESFTLSHGDGLCALCAICFGIHIMVIDHFAPYVDGVSLSAIQFLVSGILAGIPMLIWEQPSLSVLINAAAPILYAGVLSSACGYTLQIIGQQYAEPTTATLLMCLEAVFSMVGGIIILQQIPSHRELIGSLLMFIAAVLAQVPIEHYFFKRVGKKSKL